MDKNKIKYFLTIHISNCLYNGTAYLEDADRLIISNDFSNYFREIEGIDFRGVGFTTVRGNHQSLNIGIGGAFYNSKESISRTEMFSLRAKVRKILNDCIKYLSYSEVRIEVTKEIGDRSE